MGKPKDNLPKQKVGAKPYGVGGGRLWLEAHLSRVDPKIADPYASQVEAEIDDYVRRTASQVRYEAFMDAARIVRSFVRYSNSLGGVYYNQMADVNDVSRVLMERAEEEFNGG